MQTKWFFTLRVKIVEEEGSRLALMGMRDESRKRTETIEKREDNQFENPEPGTRNPSIPKHFPGGSKGIAMSFDGIFSWDCVTARQRDGYGS